MGQTLQLLRPLVSGRGTLDDMLVDNACSAVAKVLVAMLRFSSQQPQQQPQLVAMVDQVLPVLLSALPIRSDHEEDAPVYVTFLGTLLAMTPRPSPFHNMLAKEVPRIVPVLVRAAGMCESSTVRDGVVAALRCACTCFGVQPAAAVGDLGSEEVQWLQRTLGA